MKVFLLFILLAVCGGRAMNALNEKINDYLNKHLNLGGGQNNGPSLQPTVPEGYCETEYKEPGECVDQILCKEDKGLPDLTQLDVYRREGCHYLLVCCPKDSILKQPETTDNPGQTGQPGTNGNPGSTGQPGTTENPGTSGQPGTNGNPGQTGQPGTSGNPGHTGQPGTSGNPGQTGQPGTTGNPGQTGQPGTSGNPGQTGQPGTTGNPGQTGQPGTTGNPGSTGQPGTNGNPGSTGQPGTNGNPGSTVQPGTNGNPGSTGQPGTTGNPGQTGQPGTSGNPGQTGQPGTNGNPGQTNAGCGWSKPDLNLIVPNGNFANYGEFPWMVAVLRRNNWNQQMYVGGGTLLLPNVVMTVAHKLEGFTADQLKCRAGEWDTQTTLETYPHQEKNVHTIYRHSDFNIKKGHNDVALLLLKGFFDITRGPQIGTACLGRQLPPMGTKCYSMGWGQLSFENKDEYAVTLKKVPLPLVERSSCLTSLRSVKKTRFFKLHNSMVCAGGIEGYDTCKGDGGAPLVCEISDGPTPRYAVYGMVMLGVDCGTTVPGVYVNIPTVFDWIVKTLQDLQFDTSIFTSF